MHEKRRSIFIAAIIDRQSDERQFKSDYSRYLQYIVHQAATMTK